MRRIVFPIIGLLEWAVAAVLITFGLRLPAADEIAHGFQSTERVTRKAGDQVRILRRQVKDLRQPELIHLAERLQSQTRTFAVILKEERIDFDTLQAMRDAIGPIADSLEGLARSIDPAGKDVRQQAELRMTLFQSARLLRAAGKQLDEALRHRDSYEETVRQTVSLAELFAAMLPLLSEQFDSRLAEEEQALAELESSLDEVQSCLPVYAQMMVNVLEAGRWLAWLGATIAGMHGGYLMLTARLGRRYSM
jgi:hypothetical protein